MMALDVLPHVCYITIIIVLLYQNYQLRQTIAKQKETIAKQDKTIADMNKTIADMNKTIADMNKTIADMNKKLEQLETNNKRGKKNKTRDPDVSELQQQVKDLNAKVKRLEKEVRDQDFEIKCLRNGLKEMESTVASQKSLILKQNRHIANLTSASWAAINLFDGWKDTLTNLIRAKEDSIKHRQLTTKYELCNLIKISLVEKAFDRNPTADGSRLKYDDSNVPQRGFQVLDSTLASFDSGNDLDCNKLSFRSLYRFRDLKRFFAAMNQPRHHWVHSITGPISESTLDEIKNEFACWVEGCYRRHEISIQSRNELMNHFPTPDDIQATIQLLQADAVLEEKVQVPDVQDNLRFKLDKEDGLSLETMAKAEKAITKAIEIMKSIQDLRATRSDDTSSLPFQSPPDKSIRSGDPHSAPRVKVQPLPRLTHFRPKRMGKKEGEQFLRDIESRNNTEHSNDEGLASEGGLESRNDVEPLERA